MFTPSELSFFDEKFLNKFSACAKFKISMESLLNGWQNVISEVEKGYSLGINDYTNDLTLRDLIEEVLRGCPEDLKEKISLFIKRWDEKFDHLTQKAKRPLLKIDKEFWWWGRIPLNLKDPLKSDLQRNGLI